MEEMQRPVIICAQVESYENLINAHFLIRVIESYEQFDNLSLQFSVAIDFLFDITAYNLRSSWLT